MPWRVDRDLTRGPVGVYRRLGQILVQLNAIQRHLHYKLLRDEGKLPPDVERWVHDRDRKLFWSIADQVSDTDRAEFSENAPDADEHESVEAPDKTLPTGRWNRFVAFCRVWESRLEFVGVIVVIGLVAALITSIFF